MSRQLYSQIKDDTPLVTFKCEGCGQRFPQERLYPHSSAIDLRRGVYARGKRLIKMVCSRACLYRAPARSPTAHATYLLLQFQSRPPPRSPQPVSRLPQLFHARSHHKTHCVHGHPFSVANTQVIAREGYARWQCRTCLREAQQRWKRQRVALRRAQSPAVSR